ncbi:hypothetical protein FEP94_06455 [Burkholderia pseudomultivorans]|nr:hypothetical protein [Burkholderia pseudomultivorans]MDR8871698.1 hypothetical protein [Burkholderia pseudomultivorans]
MQQEQRRRRTRGAGERRERGIRAAARFDARRVHAAERRPALSDGRADRAVPRQACRARARRCHLPGPDLGRQYLGFAEPFAEGAGTRRRCRRAAMGSVRQGADRIPRRACANGIEPGVDDVARPGVLQRSDRRDECDPDDAPARAGIGPSSFGQPVARHASRTGRAGELHAGPRCTRRLFRPGRRAAARTGDRDRTCAARRRLRAVVQPGGRLWRTGLDLSRLRVSAACIQHRRNGGGRRDHVRRRRCRRRRDLRASRLGMAFVGHELGRTASRRARPRRRLATSGRGVQPHHLRFEIDHRGQQHHQHPQHADHEQLRRKRHQQHDRRAQRDAAGCGADARAGDAAASGRRADDDAALRRERYAPRCAAVAGSVRAARSRERRAWRCARAAPVRCDAGPAAAGNATGTSCAGKPGGETTGAAAASGDAAAQRGRAAAAAGDAATQ